MFGILRWNTLERLLCLTSAGLERLFVLLVVCRAWTNETRKSLRGAVPTGKSFRGAAPKPLALSYPLGTSTWTRMDAERDKGEVAKILYFEEVILRLRLYLNDFSVWIISKIGIISKRYEVVAKVLNFAVVFSRAFVLLNVCRAWARVIIPATLIVDSSWSAANSRSRAIRKSITAQQNEKSYKYAIGGIRTHEADLYLPVPGSRI